MYYKDEIEITINRSDDIMLKHTKDKQWLIISSDDLYEFLTTNKDLFRTECTNGFCTMYIKKRYNDVIS